MVLRNLSVLAVEIGEHAAGEVYGGEVLALGHALRSAWVTAAGLTQLGYAAFGLGKTTRARSLLEESLLAARASGDRPSISRALDVLGNVLLTLGHQQQAGSVLRESLQLRYDLSEWPSIPTSLESLARLWSTGSRTEKAARQLGAAAGLRDALQLPQTPREQATVARWLPGARQQLGEQAFDAAWAAGRAAALERVVADALTSDEAIGPEPATGPSDAQQRVVASLTARQIEVLKLVADGLSDRQIAAELVLSEKTVGRHLENIFCQTGGLFACRGGSSSGARPPDLTRSEPERSRSNAACRMGQMSHTAPRVGPECL